MALRLRYNDKSIALANGQLVVGRSVECNLVVNDPLASRRHAVITMSKTGAFIADLGSKSGVVVNGSMILGARKLAAGDVIQLAGVRIQVEEVESRDEADPKLRTTLSPPAFSAVPAGFRLAPTPPLGISRVETFRPDADETHAEDDDELDLERTAEAPRAALVLDDRPPPSAGAPPSSAGVRPSSPGAPPSGAGAPPDSVVRIDSGRITAPAPDSNPQTPRSQREDDVRVGKQPALPSFPRPDNLRALATLAEKALVMNRPQEAERLLQRAIGDTLEAARMGEIDAPMLELSASLSAKLATALGSGRWFDVAVELYAVRSDLMPGPVVDLLMAAVHKAKPIDKHAFRKYLSDVRDAAGDSPARRFVIHRLEGVQRILDLK